VCVCVCVCVWWGVRVALSLHFLVGFKSLDTLSENQASTSTTTIKAILCIKCITISKQEPC